MCPLRSALSPLLAAILLGPAAVAAAGPAPSILVKLRAEGPHAVRDCAETLWRRGAALAPATADGSDSLDRLERATGVRSVRAVFRRPGEKSFAAQRRALRERLRAALARRAERRPARAAEPPDLAHLYRIELPRGADAAGAAARFRADPHVEYAQPNYSVEVDRVLDDPFLSSEGSWGQPYPDQWGLYAIDAPSAWDFSLGDGVVVAVVDTGVDLAHPDILSDLWINPGEDLDGNGAIDPSERNGVDDDGNGFVDDFRGYDFQDGDADPQDENGHGTHVAGIAAARGDNGLGIAGVAPHARVMAVRTFPPFGPGETDRVWRGVLYAAENGADVINASFSCGSVCRSNPIAEEVVAYLSDLGVAFVTSAGNDASDVMLKSPERLRESIVVGSVGPSGALAASSSFGFLVDVVAPGQDVLSLRAEAASRFWSPARFVGDAYMRLDGTSMAAPHVSGVLALLLSAEPDLGPEDLRARLRSSALDAGEPGHDRLFGAGLVQPAAALEDAPPDARGQILSPLPGDTLDTDADEFPVVGSVEGADVSGYRLELGQGDSPESWTLLAPTPAPPFQARELARLPLADLSDGAYVLRLTLTTRDDQQIHEFTPISVDRNRPVFLSAEDEEARKPDIQGREVVWESPRTRENGGSDRDLFSGVFGREGERPLVAGPAAQADAAVSSRAVAWLERGRAGFGPLDAAVQVCRRHGLRGPCLPREVTEGAGFRGRPSVSGNWLVFTERVDGEGQLRACRLEAWGCTPQRIAEEIRSPEQPSLDGRRIIWSGFLPGGILRIFTCLLGGEPGHLECPVIPVGVTGITPAPSALAQGVLSDSLVVFNAVNFNDLTSALEVCRLDPETGACPALEIARFPLDASSPAPDVSRGRVVWEDAGAHGESDVYVCEYDELRQRCPAQAITRDPAPQHHPRIDGARVVWEDERSGVARIASFELPTLSPLRDRRIRAGRPLVIPLQTVGARLPVRFSGTVNEGEDLEAIGARIVQLGPSRAWFWWHPRADQLGVYALTFRATRRSGLYTQASLRIEVRSHRSEGPMPRKPGLGF